MATSGLHDKQAGTYDYTAQIDGVTNAAFIVEGRTVYFPQDVLSLCSSVFRQMFIQSAASTAHETIDLDDKYDDVVALFGQLDPRKNKVAPITDESLQQILLLADKYNIQCVKDASEAYIKETACTSADVHQLALYCLMCDKYELKAHTEQLVRQILSRRDSTKVKHAKYFAMLSLEMKYKIMNSRVGHLEAYQRAVRPFIKQLRQVKPNGVVCNRGCGGYNWDKICVNCCAEKIPDFIQTMDDDMNSMTLID